MAFLAIENTASSSSIPPPPPPSSSDDEWIYTYDVFLSFRGTDTRNKFTDHLYNRLDQKGIFTFRDDERLERGTLIAPELSRAIKESRIAVVILSSDYASSRWCLAELAMIVECMEMKKLRVLPVFHYVDPSDVRNQRSTFREAFEKHNEHGKDNTEDLQRWRAALTKVADLAGWTLHRNKPESKVIEDIVKKIEVELKSTYSFDYKDLVGINCRFKKLENLLDMVSDEVRLIGIWGTGGMGKTTLAQVVYDRFRYKFQGSSFLAKVREKSEKDGIFHLQKQLLSDILIETNFDFLDFRWGSNVIKQRLGCKKVLVILDDVDKLDQLDALAGEKSWFGKGSRIIITTRDQHILISHKVPEAQMYTAEEMNNDEALELFSRKAFKKDHPLEGYEEISQKFIHYAKGLPLALEVLGSFIGHKDLNLWESTLARYKENPPKDILDVLKISFDGLEEREKSIYLDIACFFNGKDKGYVTKLLQILYDKPDIDIDVLLKKSLITISWGCFKMHDLLQELGREIVRCESPQEAGKRSRLWHSEDVLRVLKENSGTKSVKGIFLWSPPEKEKHLNVKAFSKMKNLRLLKISNVHLPQGLNYLSSELRSIHWARYPLESMPTSFEPEKLVELIMRSSLIKQLWKGFKSCDELKHIDLSDSKNLIEIPDLSGVPNLEQLILQGCTTLHRIHESLGNLKRLIQLDLKNCKCLERLPHKISLEALETFILSGCSRLKKFPEVVGNMSCLSKLSLNETAITGLPLSIEHLIGLIELDLRDCKNLSSLPNGCYSSMSLESLNLSGCSKLVKLPENLGNIKTLKELDVSRTAITGLPLSIEHLIGLIKLILRDCKNLSSLPDGCYSSMSLKILNLSGCSKLDELPENLGKIESLEELDLNGTAITGLPSSFVHLKNLKFLSLSGCVGPSSRRSPDPMGTLERSLIGLCSLTKLDLSYCNVQTIPNVLGCLSSLERLNLCGNNFVCLPESIIQLSNLRKLYIGGCTRLRMLPKLPLNIEYIDATKCTSLETLSLRPECDFRPDFRLLNCDKLIKNQGHDDLVSTMLRRYIINTQDQQGSLNNSVTIPGSEIPKWFSHQNVGASVNLQVPSDLLGNKLMGIVVCVVFVFRKHYPLHQLHNQYCGVTHLLRCSVGLKQIVSLILSEEFDKIESYQLWVQYFSSTCFGSVWKGILNQVNANEFSQIEVKFEPKGPGLEVTKCGAHLVFKRDIEDVINQTKAWPSSCIITPYDEDGFEDSEKDTKIKRSSDDSDGERSGPSGEATSNDEPPHLKWLRHPALIENWFGNLHTQG